jgi:hypothetical protein
MSAGPHRIEIETLLASLRPGEPYTEWGEAARQRGRVRGQPDSARTGPGTGRNAGL